jgi:hypothetical protein
MRGIARSGLFKSHGLDKSYGPPFASLPSGVDASGVPVVVGVNAVLYNPKNLGFGSVTPQANISSSLRANLKNIAKNSTKPPVAMVVFTAYHKPDSELFVSVIYSKYPNFPAIEVKEKNMIVPSGSAVTFSLMDLDPGATYYVKAQARSLETGVSCLPTPSSPIVINTPIAPQDGWFAGAYYIDGEITSLNMFGDGEYNGAYYINGQLTELEQASEFCWNGVHQNLQYFCGVLADGLINGQWWYQGVHVNQLFYNGGNGVIDGLLYQNFNLLTGYYENTWYSLGVPRPSLNSSGSGFVGQLAYMGGTPYTGPLNNSYYVNGEPTTLSTSGTGTWNGQYFSGGAFIGNVGNPYDSGQTSSQGSRFSEGVTYG